MNKVFTTLVLVCCINAISGNVAGQRPNLIVIYSDDAGYADFGFQPNAATDMEALTPSIDTIARDGVRLSNAYMAGAVCSPSRAALNTGRYQSRFGFDNNLPPGQNSGLSLAETFGAKRLQELGYKTALIGKWHLGYPKEFQPNQRGFDWFYGCLQGSRSYFPQQSPSAHQVILENSVPTKESGYITDRIGEAACKFIGENSERPFYLFVSFTAPHGPLEPKQQDLKRLGHITNPQRKKYAGLMVSLDDNVGKILSAISAAGITDRTLVVFTNDNGGQTSTGAINSPLRGKKGEFYEGGIRVPWAMRWPGKIESGSVIDDPICAIDLLPTFIAAAGGEVASEWKLDGVNLLPRLKGETNSLASRPLYWRKGGANGQFAIREGKWKLIVEGKSAGSQQLFDLESDISESHNLYEKHPEIAQHLKSKLEIWANEMVEPLWGPK